MMLKRLKSSVIIINNMRRKIPRLLSESYATTPMMTRPAPPGPPGWPLLGNLVQMTKTKDKRLLYRQFQQQYGDVFSLSVCGQRVVVVNGVDRLHEVLVKLGSQFQHRPDSWAIKTVKQGNAITHANGDIWWEHRSFLIKFLADMDQTTLDGYIRNEVQAFLAELEKKQGQDIDTTFLLQAAMNNVSLAMCFGKRFQYDDAGFKELVNTVLDVLLLIQRPETEMVNLFSFLENVPGDPFGCRLVHASIEKELRIVKNWISQHRMSPPDQENVSKYLIDCYFQELEGQTEKGGTTTFSDDLLAIMIGDMTFEPLLRLSMQWCFVFLTSNTDVQDGICNEVNSILKAKEKHHLCFTDMEDMPLTMAAILETLRLGDSIPFAAPHHNTDDVIVGDYVIPAGSTVVTNLNSVHHDPELWENPMEFNPSRFLGTSGQLVTTCGQVTSLSDQPAEVRRVLPMPFSLGTRQCPGRDVVLKQMFLFITSIMQRYRILPPEEEQMTPTTTGVVNVFHQPLPHRVRFVERSQ